MHDRKRLRGLQRMIQPEHVAEFVNQHATQVVRSLKRSAVGIVTQPGVDHRVHFVHGAGARAEAGNGNGVAKGLAEESVAEKHAVHVVRSAARSAEALQSDKANIAAEVAIPKARRVRRHDVVIRAAVLQDALAVVAELQRKHDGGVRIPAVAGSFQDVTGGIPAIAKHERADQRREDQRSAVAGQALQRRWPSGRCFRMGGILLVHG